MEWTQEQTSRGMIYHRTVADHGLIDERGRSVGCVCWIEPRWPHEPAGVRMYVQPARNGRGYGASQNGTVYASVEDAKAAAPALIEAQRKRYAKKYQPSLADKHGVGIVRWERTTD